MEESRGKVLFLLIRFLFNCIRFRWTLSDKDNLFQDQQEKTECHIKQKENTAKTIEDHMADIDDATMLHRLEVNDFITKCLVQHLLAEYVQQSF